MIGRTRTALAVMAVVVLAGCGDAPSNGTAAEVGGGAVSRDQYEEVLNAVVANPGGVRRRGGRRRPAPSPVMPAAACSQAMILDVAGKEFLADEGESITDADRQIASESLGAQVDSVAGRCRRSVRRPAGGRHRVRPSGGELGGAAGSLRGVPGRSRRAVRAPHPRRDRGGGGGGDARARRRR